MKLNINEFARLLRLTPAGAKNYIYDLKIKPVEPGRKGKPTVIDLADIAERLGCTEYELLTYIKVRNALKDAFKQHRGKHRL
jgi:TPP-dependent trihydroxycyclohexane-1,2-dione (THcHDO) dehydratase